MKDQKTEIREAIAAADDALGHLHGASAELNKAGNWGLVDMLGGGLFTTVIKHGYMGNAQEEIEQAKASLKRFAKELNDVDKNAGLDVEVGGFLGFADYFFDGIIADWLVQSKIDTAKGQVSDAIRQVEHIRYQLTRLK